MKANRRLSVQLPEGKAASLPVPSATPRAPLTPHCQNASIGFPSTIPCVHALTLGLPTHPPISTHGQQVFNSTFEGCLGRYGGGAIFACGADISDSIFDSNEATGLFGAVVNGDLSDEIRANASLSLGVAGENYTCPPLFVSSTFFESNVAATGYGGAIASVDSSLSVFNTSVLSTLGGGIYFGTSSSDGRDQLEVSQAVGRSVGRSPPAGPVGVAAESTNHRITLKDF